MTKHLIKFFRGDVAPQNPAVGTVWFDNTVDGEVIKVWTGTIWEVYGVTKSELATAIDNLRVLIMGTTKDGDSLTIAAINDELDALGKAIEQAVFDVVTYSTRKLNDEEIAELGENVKEAFVLTQTKNVKVTKVDEETGESIEVVEKQTTDVEGADKIIIYKDASLISVELVAEKPVLDENGDPVMVQDPDKPEDPDAKIPQVEEGQFIKYTYVLANGLTETVYVNVSEILLDTEIGDGLKKSDAGVISVKIDAAGSVNRAGGAYLTVGENGIKLDLSDLHALIEENELVTAAALNDINERVATLEDTFDEFGVSGDADSFSVVEGTVEEGLTVKNTLATDVASTEYPAEEEYTSPTASGLATDKYVQDYVASVFGWTGWADPTPVVEEEEGEGEGEGEGA